MTVSAGFPDNRGALHIGVGIISKIPGFAVLGETLDSVRFQRNMNIRFITVQHFTCCTVQNGDQRIIIFLFQAAFHRIGVHTLQGAGNLREGSGIRGGFPQRVRDTTGNHHLLGIKIFT